MNQLQLSIINSFLNTSVSSSTTLGNVEQALAGLSQIFNTPLVIYTSVYKDKNNREYKLKHQYYAENTKTNVLSHLRSSFQENKTPQLINQLYKNHNEVLIKESHLMDCFVADANLPELKGENKMVVIPFYNGKYLAGMLSYRGDKLSEIQLKYPALFNTINTIFIDESREKNHQIKMATYQAVLDLMPQRVFWKNRQSVYLGCNKAFSDDASLHCPKEIVGMSDFELFPEQADLYRSDDANTMRTLEHLIASEEPQTQENGNKIWLRTSKRPIIDSEEHVIGVVGTYDDITQLKETQYELKKAKDSLEKRVIERTKDLSESKNKLEIAISDLKSTQDQLIENEKMASLGSLVAGIAHEINTPLGVAVTSASNLEHIATFLHQSVESGNLKKSIFIEKCNDLVTSSDLIINNLEKASELVKNFKMIAVDQTYDEKRTINLYKYLNKVVHAMTPKLAKKNIRIFLAGDENINISIYPGAISQIITNLIDNAFIHAFEKMYNGEIKLQFKKVENNLDISMQDNGVGIREEIVSKIFDPFYTTKRGQGGTGLGLSVVYNLVNQKLNGTISCQSELEEWTRFVISIPLKRK